MEMEEFLIKLRKKPVHTRRAILAITTTAITGVILIIWLLSLTSRLNENYENKNAAATPVFLVKDNWRNFTGSMKGSLTDLKSQLQF